MRIVLDCASRVWRSPAERSSRNRGAILAIIGALWSGSAQADPPMRVVPTIAVTAQGIAITGLTPRAVSIVFGVSRETRGYMTGYVRHDYLLRSVDALGNAIVHLAAVSPHAVWSVVDLQTGAFATAAPSGAAPRRKPFPSDALRAVNDVQLNRLRLKHDFLEVLWVRPGLGAWFTSAGDGGASDADHTLDGYLSITAEQMEPIGASPPPPKHYLPTDTFILVDPDTMELFTLPAAQ